MPELENMLQTDTRATFQEQWSTPQWNFSGLVSNPFAVTDQTAVNTTKHNAVFSTSNMDTASINYFSVAVHHEPYTAVGLYLPSFGSSPQSSNELPLLPPFPSDDDGMWTIILDTVVGWATVFHCQSDSGEPVKSGSTPVGGPVKSGRKRTRDKGRGLDKRLVRPELVTAWIQRLRTTSVDPLRRFRSRRGDGDRDGDGQDQE